MQHFNTFVGNQDLISMKIGQNVIIMTMKDTGQTFLFGSLSAIYGMFTVEQLDITYSALRNAVGTYVKTHDADEGVSHAQTIYDTKRSTFTLQRAPLLLLERQKKYE